MTTITACTGCRHHSIGAYECSQCSRLERADYWLPLLNDACVTSDSINVGGIPRQRVVIFRGWHTADVERGAHARWPGCDLIVVAEPGDRMRQESDVTTIPWPEQGEDLIVLVNAEPVWPMLSAVVRLVDSLAHSNEESEHSRTLRLVELTRHGGLRDGPVWYVGQRELVV